MTILAIIYIAAAVVCLLPGSAYTRRPQINWESPHIYAALTASVCAASLAIWTLVA